jgi:hypothetical protein
MVYKIRDDGLGEFYHLRKAQVLPYHSDFTAENSDLRTENTFFG